ncbi:helix-turn-helix domain-containing protein [Paenibacillus sp. MCAF9]|uniref:helix-turn-helix domain-containing protein n=1 Tax=Paenibacillus sp. MCAF9 TaxID=3233046 RepID=UPI003F946661
MNYLGQNVRTFRKEKGLTIQQLADKSSSSISSISEIENGKRDPTFKLILKIAEALEIDVAKLVTNPETFLFTHKIEICLSFNDDINFIVIGESKSTKGSEVQWGLILEVSQEIKLIDTICFFSNNEIQSSTEFYSSELAEYIRGQALKILVNPDIELSGTLSKARESGLPWEEFKVILNALLKL